MHFIAYFLSNSSAESHRSQLMLQQAKGASFLRDSVEGYFSDDEMFRRNHKYHRGIRVHTVQKKCKQYLFGLFHHQ